MSKKDCFDEVIRLFKGYEGTKRTIDAGFESLKNSGMYSKKYLNAAAEDNDAQLRKEHSRIVLKIDKVREKFQKELDAEFDLTATAPDAALVALVNSGISPTEKEFANLAQKYKGNYVNSRILHDFADRNGFILRNLPTREGAEFAFNNFIRHITGSMYVQGEPIYSDSSWADGDARGILSSLESLPMDCYKKPETLEESITQTIAMERVDRQRTEKEIDHEAFCRGFWGDIEKAEPETQETTGQALTEEERADAKWLSLYNGNKGEITQKEIDFIHSSDYKRYLEERNGSDNKNTDQA